jgi:hypothetical protein
MNLSEDCADKDEKNEEMNPQIARIIADEKRAKRSANCAKKNE